MIIQGPINELFKALSLVQGKLEDATRNGNNPYFNNAKYAKLEAYLIEARPILSENGLSVTQMIETIESKTVLTTMLCHSSGASIASSFELKLTKQDMQGLGSAITYARRYAYAAIIGMGSEDDDANKATGKEDKNEKGLQGTNRPINNPQQGFAKPKHEPQIRPQNSQDNEQQASQNNTQLGSGSNEISESQLRRFHALRNQSGWTEDETKLYLKDKFSIDSSKKLTQIQYKKICKYLETKTNFNKAICEP